MMTEQCWRWSCHRETKDSWMWWISICSWLVRQEDTEERNRKKGEVGGVEDKIEGKRMIHLQGKAKRKNMNFFHFIVRSLKQI